MPYKIELRYAFPWDDAEWTEEDVNGVETPLRFQTIDEAQAALEAFFALTKEAVAQGNMDVEEDPADYRIVHASNRGPHAVRIGAQRSTVRKAT